jgi:hypothetical protein
MNRISNSLPLGHFVEGKAKLYNKDTREWFYDDNWIDSQTFIDNDIVVGYDESSKNFIAPVFKLRFPKKETEENLKDGRKKLRGFTCAQKDKTIILGICKKLNIKIKKNTSIENLCSIIKRHLISKEIIEREKNSNIKYFYMHFEKK